MVLLEKFKDSLNVQLEKAKKSIENISFKNTENCTFEDFRDGQFNNEKKSDKNNDNIRRYKRHKSSKYNNYMFNNLGLGENINNNKINKNKIKKSVSNKHIIIENDLEDMFEEGEEEIAALDRLNKAYQKFGKENLDVING